MIPGLGVLLVLYACFLSLFELPEACFVLRQRKTAKRFETNSTRKKRLCRKVNSRREYVEHHDKTCLEKKKEEKAPDSSKNMLRATPSLSMYHDWHTRYLDV